VYFRKPKPFRFLRDLMGETWDYSGRARKRDNEKSAATTMSYRRFHFSSFFGGFCSIPVGTTTAFMDAPWIVGMS
jgi:hypothetical protein